MIGEFKLNSVVDPNSALQRRRPAFDRSRVSIVVA
jgi:hypothetical protein